MRYAKTVSFNEKTGWIRSTSSDPGTFDDPVEVPDEVEPIDPSNNERAWHYNGGNPELRYTGIWDEVRSDRNQELTESDWAVLPDAPITSTEQDNVETYRQNLRDLPQDYDTPQEARNNWPTKPDCLT